MKAVRKPRSWWVRDKPPRLVWVVCDQDDESPVEFVAVWLKNIFSVLSLYTWVDIISRAFYGKVARQWIAELWVALMILALTLVLFVLARPGSYLAFGLALYVLYDITGVLLETIAGPLLLRDKKGAYGPIRSRTRWLIMTLLNVVEIVLAYALLILFAGNEFRIVVGEATKALDTATEALYQSAVTLTTLGFGDIRAEGVTARWLMITELAFFIVILAARLPVAISAIRLKEEKNGWQEDR